VGAGKTFPADRKPRLEDFMLFLVCGENIDPGYLLPPDQTMQAVEQAVLPSFQQIAEWEQQGKVKGGLYPGERAGAFVVDVESYEELDSMMNHLPFFGIVKWQVKPLMTFASVAQQVPGYIRDIRQQMQQGGQ
jgi:muconolactone delta-isomerase